VAGLEVGLADGVLTLRLNRPEQFNALTAEMVRGLVTELRGAVARDDVRVVVLTGAGPAFCAGAALEGERPQDRYDAGSVDAANLMVRSVVELDKPVLCALNGIAAGVGLSLALACDVLVAAESAGLTLAFTAIGLMPDGGATATLAASVGRHRALRMALTSEVLSAADARDAGVVAQVVPDEGFEAEVDRWARRLARGAPLAFAATKKAVNAATLAGLDEAFARERSGQSVLLRTDDVAEGMRAFLDKRRPEFRGR
jgi:enoyl-CoA hydratase